MSKTNVLGGTRSEFLTAHDRAVFAGSLHGEAKRLLARLEQIPDQVRHDCIDAPSDDRTLPGYYGRATRPEAVDLAPVLRIEAELWRDIEAAFRRMQAQR